MPCNAVATASATVDDQELLKYLDHDTLLAVLRERLVAEGYEVTRAWVNTGGVGLTLNGLVTVRIDGSGRITVQDQARTDNRRATVLMQVVKEVLQEAAGILFQNAILAQVNRVYPVQQQHYTADGTMILTTNLAGLLSRVVVTLDGTTAVFTDEGSYEGGRGAITQLFSLLQQQIAFAEIGEVEQHRHGAEGVHVHGYGRLSA